MKIVVSLVLAAVVLSTPAAFATDKGMTTISGHVNKEDVTSVLLFQVIEGKKVEFASTRLGLNNDFAFAFLSIKEGFYYLADQRKSQFIRIYLKEGEKMELELNEDGYEVVNGSKENKLLHEWHVFSSIITKPAFYWMKDTSSYLSFFPKVEAFWPQIPQFKERIKTKNASFNDLLRMTVDLDAEHAAMYFLLVPHSMHPKKEQYPVLYKQIIQPGKYKTAKILELGEGVELLGRYATFTVVMNPPKERPSNFLQFGAELFGNDTLKGAYVASGLRFKSYEELEKNIAPLKQYLVTDSMKQAYFRIMKSHAEFKKGSPSFNFSYESNEGRKVSMNDLKGKVVLIDVWATWCGPCKVEIPHLKQLEEEFKGKNVEFVSVSVDILKDKEKWKTFVAEKELGGIQLFAEGWSDIAKYYDITGIPRFLVFDQEGKIVSVDAPRPSNPELKQLLEQTLERK